MLQWPDNVLDAIEMSDAVLCLAADATDRDVWTSNANGSRFFDRKSLRPKLKTMTLISVIAFPRLRHAVLSFTSTDPRHSCFVQHDFLQVAGLQAGIIFVVGLQNVSSQSFLET